MLTGCELVAFAATTDLARGRAFYEGTLGLRVTDANPMAVVLDALGTRLRLTLVDVVATAPYTVLGWEVADIDAQAAGFAEAGVDLLRFEGMDQDELGVWTAPGGARVAWFRDPDDNTLSITQMPPADRPEPGSRS
jgi:catechol 2,3-dioxygenase-like lactoylglutathione lyase family enzyme